MIALPSLQAIARALLLTAAVGGWTWLAWTHGETHGLELRLQEAKNGEYCAAILRDHVGVTEGAADLLARRSLAQQWVLASRGLEYVAIANSQP